MSVRRRALSTIRIDRSRTSTVSSNREIKNSTQFSHKQLTTTNIKCSRVINNNHFLLRVNRKDSTNNQHKQTGNNGSDYSLKEDLNVKRIIPISK